MRPHQIFAAMSQEKCGRIMEKMRFSFAWPDRRILEETLARQDVVHIQFPFYLGIRAISVACLCFSSHPATGQGKLAVPVTVPRRDLDTVLPSTSL